MAALTPFAPVCSPPPDFGSPLMCSVSDRSIRVAPIELPKALIAAEEVRVDFSIVEGVLNQAPACLKLVGHLAMYLRYRGYTPELLLTRPAIVDVLG